MSGLETAMLRVGPVGIHWAGFALSMGFLVAGAVGRRWAERKGCSPSSWWSMATWVMLAAVLGARLTYGLMHWSNFAGQPLALLRPPLDGLSYIGGFAGGLACVWLLAWRRGESFWNVADLFALPYATGHLIAVLIWRAPITLAGLPSAVEIVGELLYISALYAVLWVVQLRQRRPLFEGELFLIAVMGDGLTRLVVGSFMAALHPEGWFAFWNAHVLRFVVSGAGLTFYMMRGEKWAPWVRPKATEKKERTSFSRWIGWLTVYGFIVCVFVMSRAVTH